LEQGRTLADVARAARVSMPYLSELERGRKEASSEILAAICDALRIELSDLLARIGSDLSGDRARKASAFRLGPSDGSPAEPPRPQAPRALADTAPVRPESSPADTAGQPAVPADARSTADALCLLAA
ncbi:MAG TPA: helix-turn-helix transcriptional regulator, partial [Streptosporangiaceae bacterium]|nr:helix-turn-helix transcriptional regulator [Streptosporangiaceae bacterium]